MLCGYNIVYRKQNTSLSNRVRLGLVNLLHILRQQKEIFDEIRSPKQFHKILVMSYND